MSKAKQDVLDMINKKMKRNKEIKKKTSIDKTYKQDVLLFLERLEDIYASATDPIEFDVLLEQACKILDRELKKEDPYVQAEVNWNNPKDWRTMRALGVTITWSNYYQNLYPNSHAMEYIDATDLIFEDF